jgi:pyruvate dehydrogenase phosphatase
VFLNSPIAFRTQTDVEDWIMRNRTPPYLDNVPDVRHVSLRAGTDTGGGMGTALLLCTDGLLDLSDDRDPARAARVIPPRERVAMHAKTWFNALCTREEDNLALRVLRDALGGEDAVRLSSMLTVDSDIRWMDDTTVLVLPL